MSLKIIVLDRHDAEEILMLLRSHLAILADDDPQRIRTLWRVDHFAALVRYWDRLEDASLAKAPIPELTTWEPLRTEASTEENETN